MNFEIRNSETGTVYGHTKTLTEARHFCQQRLLKSSDNRATFLSNLAAGLITVYEVHNTNYLNAGF